MSGQPPPTRYFRLLRASMVDARAALDAGLVAGEAAWNAGRFEQACQILLNACQDTSDAFVGLSETPAPPNAHQRRKR